ncbi:hypothetical protein KR026_010160, partial [Drosophila bipectinata]
MPEVSLKDMGFEESEKLIKCEFGAKKAFILDEINKIVRGKICPDVEIRVGNKSFRCHMPVLQLYTDFFKKFDSTDTITISAKVISAKGFELAYEWMINPEAKLQRQNILALYVAANFLDMPELLTHLWSRLDDPKLINHGNAFQLYVESIPYKVSLLQELMLDRIQKFFLLAVATEEYLDLDAKHVFDMLCNSNMCVNSEMEMFMSAVRWLLHDWSSRREYAVNLMQAIRFNSMPAWYTTVLKVKQLEPDMQELLNIPEIQSMINLGLSFSITEKFVDPASPLKEPLGLKKPLERQWVVHSGVRHHHSYECPKWQFLTLEVFNNYLVQIIAEGQSYLEKLEHGVPDQLMPCCRA